MIPHERSLVDKLQGKPFALLGVNSDRDLADYRKQQKEMGVTWRSFWCGDAGTSGPIPTQWNVRGWPTIYILDHKGVIRAKNKRGPEMEAEVEKLLAEMEQEKAGADKEKAKDAPK